MDEKLPMVSIMIPNYNYGKYLKTCLESAFKQTYKNIEVILLDNCSEDNSLEVVKPFIKQGLRLCRNPFNVHTYSYKILANLAEGKYIMLLPSDDYILPEFVEKCVSIFEKYPNVGYVHTERKFIDEYGEERDEEPFYKCSFIAPGEEVMPIYMMTTVAHPAQGMYRASTFRSVGGYSQYVEHTNADKTLWFFLSGVSDYAYIRDTLSRVRIGQYSETFISQVNFQHPLLMVLTLMYFVDYAKDNDLDAVIIKENLAKEKFAIEMLEFCAGMLINENYETAQKYLVFCQVLDRRIIENYIYCELDKMCKNRMVDKYKLNEMFMKKNKKRNYDPPKKYIPLS